MRKYAGLMTSLSLALAATTGTAALAQAQPAASTVKLDVGAKVHDSEGVELGPIASNDGSVVVVEHNLELIRCADWVIELGPDGGAQGGYLLAEGAPEQLIANPNSITGPFLTRRSGPKD